MLKGYAFFRTKGQKRAESGKNIKIPFGPLVRYNRNNIDTENNNQYLSERVGKCNRLDKCGYHYTPREYFTDNPHKRDKYLVEDGSLRPCGYHYTPREYFTDNPCLRDKDFYIHTIHRVLYVCKIENPPPTPPKPFGRLPRWWWSVVSRRGLRLQGMEWKTVGEDGFC